MKMNNKFILLIFFVLLIPLIALFIFFLNDFKSEVIEEQIKSVENDVVNDCTQIQTVSQTCNFSTQVILNSQNLINYIVKFNNNDDIETQDLITFYHNDILSLEKLVNSNPNLYNIHIYVDSNQMQEMLPVLYRTSRMKKLSWANGSDIKSGTWYFNYTDNIFPVYTNTIHGKILLRLLQK